MTTPDPPDSSDLPIGRRVAQLRTRLGMTQQVFADRLGRSKSWVDKIERGEAAIAAATCADATAARDLANRAARLATALGDHPRPDNGDLGFGPPTTVDLARALIATELGDSQQAITTHQHATASPAWPRLPAEHRAAHLIDIVRAHLDADDPQPDEPWSSPTASPPPRPAPAPPPAPHSMPYSAPAPPPPTSPGSPPPSA